MMPGRLEIRKQYNSIVLVEISQLNAAYSVAGKTCLLCTRGLPKYCYRFD